MLNHIAKRSRGYLPHWERIGATYFVTFRLADSLPRRVLESFLFERRDILRRAEQQGRQLTVPERRRLAELFSKRAEGWLDAGAGACFLREARIAELVVAALRRFDRKRYRLLAWCIMPNHVHVVFEITLGEDLAAVVHSWKSYTANQINGLLGRKGALWHREYYDRLVRNDRELDRAVQYVIRNPEKAGLKNWNWVWAQP